MSTTINIVHFNDVYNIEPGIQEPVGGAARFVTAVRQLSDQNPLILFSGDALNPSLMSTVTHGHQMIPVLNSIGVHCALYGNHDFDYGVDNLVEVAKKTKFPWLLSNVVDIVSGGLLAEGHATHMITWNGKKIGFVGLIEEEWIATLSTLDPEDVEYIDFVSEGRRLALELKQQGADYIIALTHMRWPNDTLLAENVDEIDLILGGHDHDYTARRINGKLVVKSGTDFRGFANVKLVFKQDGSVESSAEEFSVTSDIAEDEKVKAIVEQYTKILGDELDTVIGRIEVDLDGRFESIRRRETNLGNFVTNIMLSATNADVALLNSGTLRSDRIHPIGEFRLRDLVSILPMVDNIVVIEVTGTQLLEALENGVSKYPALEGRFPQVSGIVFQFDASQEPGRRIVANSVHVQSQPIQANKKYRLCTKGYLTKGKDGYDCLIGSREIVNEEDGPQLSTIVQNHFKSVQIVSGHHRPQFHHRQSIIAVSKRRTISSQLSEVDAPALEHLPSLREDIPATKDTDEVDAVFSKVTSKFARRRWHKAKFALAFTRRRRIEAAECEELPQATAPCIENRIKVIGDNSV